MPQQQSESAKDPNNSSVPKCGFATETFLGVDTELVQGRMQDMTDWKRLSMDILTFKYLWALVILQASSGFTWHVSKGLIQGPGPVCLAGSYRRVEWPTNIIS